jgi:hypothetical protein
VWSDFAGSPISEKIVAALAMTKKLRLSALSLAYFYRLDIFFRFCLAKGS